MRGRYALAAMMLVMAVVVYGTLLGVVATILMLVTSTAANLLIAVACITILYVALRFAGRVACRVAMERSLEFSDMRAENERRQQTGKALGPMLDAIDGRLARGPWIGTGE